MLFRHIIIFVCIDVGVLLILLALHEALVVSSPRERCFASGGYAYQDSFGGCLYKNPAVKE